MNGDTDQLPGLMLSVNDAKFNRLLVQIGNAPNLYLRAGALETCLRQVWALVPEEDEELFFDNIQLVTRQAEKWTHSPEKPKTDRFFEKRKP